MTTTEMNEFARDCNEAGHSGFPVITDSEIGGDAMMTVDARELHAFLGTGKDFSTWIKDRIAQYDFSEGVDFASFEATPQNGGAGNRGLRKEYALTLDMAKEVAMVDRSERGRQVRRYFIECERRARDVPDASLLLARALSDPQQARALLLDQVERNAELQGRISELEPQVRAFDRIANADGSMCITDAAKHLQMRPKDLFAYLRQNGWIYRRPGAAHDIAYQSKLISGVLEHKVTTVTRSDGSEKVTEQVRVTAKGLTRLAKILTPSLALVEDE